MTTESGVNKYLLTAEVDSPDGPGVALHRVSERIRPGQMVADGLAIGALRLSAREAGGCGPDGRRTVQVTHTVDVPAGVTDEQVADVFVDMRVEYPALTGWWISVPQVAAVPAKEETS
jgi:hypothetical protein